MTANEVSKNVFDLRPDGDKVIIYSWAVVDPGHVYALPRGRKIPLVNGLDEAAVDWFLEKFYQPYYDRYKDAFQDGTIPAVMLAGAGITAPLWAAMKYDRNTVLRYFREQASATDARIEFITLCTPHSICYTRDHEVCN